MADTTGTFTSVGNTGSFWGWLRSIPIGGISDEAYKTWIIDAIVEEQDASPRSFFYLNTGVNLGANKLFHSVTVNGVTILFEDFAFFYAAPQMQYTATTETWAIPTSGNPFYKVTDIPIAKPQLLTPYSDLLNLNGDSVELDLRVNLEGETSFNVIFDPAIPTGLTEVGGYISGTITQPTGTARCIIEATNSFGTITTEFQWTTLTIGAPSNIN